MGMPAGVVAKLLKGKCLVCAAPVQGRRKYCPEHRKSKYRSQPVMVDGCRFDSKREARRYAELKLLHGAGQIRNLRLQVRYPIAVKGLDVCEYIADFVYDEPDGDGWRHVVEDAKGHKTAVYRLKKKLMWACHGIEVRET